MLKPKPKLTAAALRRAAGVQDRITGRMLADAAHLRGQAVECSRKARISARLSRQLLAQAEIADLD